MPGSYTDTANNAEETEPPSALRFSPSPPPVATGQGVWSFTKPLTDVVHIAGNVGIAADVSVVAPVSLVALVYDIDAAGTATFVARGASRVAESGKLDFELYPQDWTFRPGHRIGVLLTSADVYWFNPSNTLTPVAINGGTVSLPVLQCARHAPAPTGAPNFVPRTSPAPYVVAAATLAAATIDAALPPPMRTDTIGPCQATLSTAVAGATLHRTAPPTAALPATGGTELAPGVAGVLVAAALVIRRRRVR
jgi:hypothetical protein